MPTRRSDVLALSARVPGVVLGLTLSLFLVLPGVASAQSQVPTATYSTTEVDHSLTHIGLETGPTADPKDESPEGVSCYQAYERLYAKDTLKIHLFLGYNDRGDAPNRIENDGVFDPFVKQYVTEVLTRPCPDPTVISPATMDDDGHGKPEKRFACGFTEKDGVLTKTVSGPDGKSRTAEIVIEDSAASDSDRDNQHELKKEQKAKSLQVNKDYAASMSGTQVLLYYGHSRGYFGKFGTGPGFKPLPRFSLAWFDAGILEPSKRSMLKALSHSEDPPILFGFFGCRSEEYYKAGLLKADPNLALILTSTGVLNQINLSGVLGTMDAVLGQRCEGDFTKSLFGAHLSGFFR